MLLPGQIRLVEQRCAGQKIPPKNFVTNPAGSKARFNCAAPHGGAGFPARKTAALRLRSHPNSIASPPMDLPASHQIGTPKSLSSSQELNPSTSAPTNVPMLLVPTASQAHFFFDFVS